MTTRLHLTIARVRQLLGAAARGRIVVLGDVMLDQFLWGQVRRISPEAPVPVVEWQRESFIPGGAANVARNLASLNAPTELLGVVGADHPAEMLRALLRQDRIQCSGLLTIQGRLTSLKTRIIAHRQQVVRVDKESPPELGPEVTRRLLRALEKKLDAADAVIIGDYAKGVVTQELLEGARRLCRERAIWLSLDPKPAHRLDLAGVSLLTPNRKEAFELAGITDSSHGTPPLRDKVLLTVADNLLTRLAPAVLLITLGEQGLLLCRRGLAPVHIPTVAREVFDVSGAGDTTIAAFTLAIVAGASPVEAAIFSNHAAGVVVGKLGTAAVQPQELLESFRHQTLQPAPARKTFVIGWDDDKDLMKTENGNAIHLEPGGPEPAFSPKGAPPEKESDSNESHFNTDHLRTNLKNRTVSSGFVTLSSQGVKFALTILSTAILARLLERRDFGLLAMVTSIMSLLRIFKDAGLSSATVQREDITHSQVSNLFWINVGVAGLLSLVMCGLAPAIAWFYHEPKLLGITLWLSLTFLVSGSTVQHQALLQRQMRFKAMAVIQVGAMIVNLLVGVIMALSGCGFWSLVGMNLASEGAAFALTWSVSRWRPQRPKRGCGTRSLLNFGVNMTAGSASWILSRSVDTMLIGWRYGADATGLYSRALALLMRPLDQLLAPVSAVFIPTLSRLQNEPERFRRTFLRLYEAIALVSFGFSGLFLALSQPITLFLLGRKWEAAAIIFKAFAIGAPLSPIATSVVWMMISQGRGREYFRMNLITAFVTIASFVIGLPFGPVGVALSFSLLGLVVSVPVVYFLAGRKGPVRTSDLWTRLFRHLPLWIVVTAVTMLVRARLAAFSPFLQLLICGPVGLAAGIGTIMAIKPERDVALHLAHAVRGALMARVKP